MAAGTLTNNNVPDAAALWRALQRVVERVGAALEGEAVLEDCLDIVVEQLDADRGLIVLENTDATTTIVHARRAQKTLSRTEQEEVSKTLVRQALDTNEVVVWTKRDHSVDSLSVSMLDIHAALVAPFRGRGVPRGVLYVDFRHPLKSVELAHQEFFMAAVVLVAAMLEQNASMRAVRDRLQVAQSHLTEASQVPPLDDLLRPRSMERVREEVALALSGSAPVLVLGESGSGKTLFAQAFAEASGRTPIVRVVLGASDDLNTITSELFGHERGSFSGATGRRVGLVEYANGGTLVLDEVMNLSLHAQKLLLDFTQFGTYRPLGHAGPDPKKASVRLLAVTNGDLSKAMREGRFREDLYYRLAGVTVRLPPLRERCEDIPSLSASFLRRLGASRNWTIALEARRRLVSSGREWTGNVRELEWVLQRAPEKALSRDPTSSEIRLVDLDLAGPSSPRSAERLAEPGGTPKEEWTRLQELRAQLDLTEAELVRASLERNHHVVAHAARELGVARTTLAGRAQAMGLTFKR